MIKKEYIDKCSRFCKNKKKAQVLHASSVLKLNDNGSGKKKRVLVITNQFITYFKEQSEIKPDHLQYWRNVASFDVNDQTVIIKFADQKAQNSNEEEKLTQLRFIHPNVEEVQSVLIQLFLRTFAPDELVPLDLSHFPHPPIEFNARGVLSRFDTILRMENKEPKIPIRQFLKQHLVEKPKCIKFEEPEEIKDVLSSTLEALRPLPYVQYISLPKIDDSSILYEGLSVFVSKNSQVKMLALHNNADINSTQFFDAFRDSPVTQLKGLTFEDVEFTEDELNKVHDLSIQRQFSSAAFINCVHQPLLSSFSSNYLTNDLMTKLRYLSLDKTTGINLKKLTRRIQALSVLSLAECDIEISDALEIFGEAQLEKLRYLNLSGNKMTKSTSAQLPPNLECFHISNVTWGSGAFPEFLKYFLSQTFGMGLKLNCSSARDVSEDDWDAVSDGFDEIQNYPLQELSWSYNRVSESLITYLSKNTSLTTLFLSNCFKVDDEPKVYEKFCKKLPIMSSLYNLVVNGSEGYELGDQASELFETLKQLKSLNLLVVDGNNLNDQGVQQIKDLVTSNNSINTVSFDKSNISSIDVIRELIDAGKARRRPLHISWPHFDLIQLHNDNKVTAVEIINLKKDLISLSTGRGPVVSDAQWLQNFNIAEQQKQTAASQRNAKNLRGSVRIKANQQKIQQQNEQKTDNGRKIRAGSFRGLKRPSLITTERSPTEEDPNLWVNEPFDMFVVELTDEFPLFLNDDITKYFEKHPLAGDEKEGHHHHHSSKHHSSKHHSSKHHSSKHHSSKHHSSKHHHHHHKDEGSENQAENESENQNENGEVKTRSLNLDVDNDDEENERLEREKERRDREERERLEKEQEEEREKERKRLNRQKEKEEKERRDREERERLEKEQEEELEKERKRLNRQRDCEERERLEKEQEEEREKERKRLNRQKEKEENERRDREERERLKREQEEELEKERKRLNRQRDREERERLEREREQELKKERQRIEREQKRKEKEMRDKELKEKRERDKQVRDRPKDFDDEDEDSNDQLQVQTRNASLPRNTERQQSSQSSVLPDLLELQPLPQPKNMFLYVDPYGRPLNEPLSLSNGSTLAPFNPEPIDLVNVASPKLNPEVSTRRKPQPERRWPSPDEIDRSSLAKDGSELREININKLRLEELPGFDDDEEFDGIDDEDLEKPDRIVIHRREREDDGNFQLPQKRFPVFPLLNVPGNSNSDKTALPIDWNFQMSQVSKIGNYKYVKQANQPLEQLIDQLNSTIK